MLTSWLERIRPPPTGDEDRDRVAGVLAGISSGTLVLGAGVMVFHGLVIGAPWGQLFSTYLPVLCLQALTLWLARSGRERLAAWTFVTLYGGSLLLFVWFFGGLREAHSAGLITVTLFAGVLLPPRQALWVVAALMLALIGIAAAEPWRPETLRELGAADGMVSVGSNLLFAAVVVVMTQGGLRRTLARARADERALAARAAQAALLARLGREAVGARGPAEFAAEALPQAREALGADGLLWVEPRGDRIRVVAFDGLPVEGGGWPIGGWPDRDGHVAVGELPAPLDGRGALQVPVPGRVDHGWLAAVGVEDEPVPRQFLTTLASLLGTVAERQQAEIALRQAQKMEAVGRLAGGVAHDFNNVLTTILGCASLLEEDLAPGSDQGRLAGDIRLAGEQAARLTRQLLAFSRQPTGDRTEAVEPDDVVRHAERLLVHALDGPTPRRLVLHLGAPGAAVAIQRGHLEQVVLNLVVNAGEAMPGGGTVHIGTCAATLDPLPVEASAFPAARPGRYACLTVADQGAGIDERTRGRVFEPFFTTKPEGSGLGLATVFGIVEQAGGFVTLDTAPDEGARFSVYLPVTATAAGEGAAAPDVPAVPSVGRILVVDDAPDIRAVAARVLGRAGWTVLEADDGDTALALLEREAVDVVLTDIVMRRMSGDELARHLAGRVPVVKMSGYPARPGEQPTEEHFLAKPFSPEALLDRVHRALGR